MNNEINLYEELKKAILKEAKESLNDFEMVKEKILKLFDMIIHINFNNMNSKEKIDYNELQRTDGNIIKFNLLSLLFDFRNKCHADDYYKIFIDSIENYKDTKIINQQKQVESEKEKQSIEKQVKNEETNGETSKYKLVKFAILKSVKDLLNEYDNVKNRILKLLNTISSVNFDNMTLKQKTDYETVIITDLNINRLNDLTILFKFIDNPNDDKIYSIFMEEIDKYRNKRIAVENQRIQRENAIKYFEEQLKIKAIKKKLKEKDIGWIEVQKDETNEDIENKNDDKEIVNESKDIEKQNEVENKIDESNIDLENDIEEESNASIPYFEDEIDSEEVNIESNVTYENKENTESENVEKHPCLKKFLKKYILKG